MGGQYFNSLEYHQAYALIEKDPFEAKARFEDYLEKYPTDYFAYTHYASVLITLGDFDMAKEILDNIEQTYRHTNYFVDRDKKIDALEKNIIINRVRLFSYKEEYSELNDYLLKHSKVIDSIGMEHLIFYCKMKNGLINNLKREENSYIFRQIIEYREDDFLRHVQKHLFEGVKDFNNPNKNLFVAGFPIEEVFEEVKKYIPSDKKVYANLFDNEYFFKYDNCGKDNNRFVDYFKVHCIHNTDKFITMLPVYGYENLPYVDLNYMVDDVKKEKVKVPSQIDKFQRRFGSK